MKMMLRLWILFANAVLFASLTLGNVTNTENSEEFNESSKTILELSVLNSTNKDIDVIQTLSDRKPNAFENETGGSGVGSPPSEVLFPDVSKTIPNNSHEEGTNIVDLTANYSTNGLINPIHSEKIITSLSTSEHAVRNASLIASNQNTGHRGDGDINMRNSEEISDSDLGSRGERNTSASVTVDAGYSIAENINDTGKRGDTSPVVSDYDEIFIEKAQLTTLKPQSDISDTVDIAASTSPDANGNDLSLQGVTLSPSTISWLDAFLLQHRDSIWILFNTFFMVTWIITGIFVLYRLFGLPWCSPHVSRTHYLVIHLLIFTTAAFEFVKLVHLSYGSHQGLPLFLILLLTHTPTPCLASSLILMIHCVFVSARVPIFGTYLPSFLYASILTSFLILFSFVGDIIVGVSHNSAFLLVHRVFLISICLICLTTFIFSYRKIVNIGYLMRREFRGELKSLAIPVSNHDESHEAKIHLKDILILWSRIILVSCIAGICMCVFSFCLSLFFTQSYVPIWAFWFLHSSIFISQIVVVLAITFGAALTLVHTTQLNVVYKYFIPFLPNQSSFNNSIVKHRNFIYQRVALSNGTSSVPRISVAPIVMENGDQDLLPNNTLVTELSTPPSFKAKVNLRRSATFNCAAPQHNTYYGMPPSPHCSTPIYPVLSEHLLPQSYSLVPHNSSQVMTSFGSNGASFYERKMGFPSGKPMLSEDSEIPYGYVSPSKRYYGYGRERFSSLRKVPYSSRRIRPEISSPISQTSMEGTLQQSLDVPILPCNNMQITPICSFSEIRNQRECENSLSNTSSPRLKVEPPEKPLRKTEPILVKSVIKENGTLESSLIVPPTNTEASAYSKHDVNLCKAEESRESLANKFSSKPYSCSLYDKNITPNLSLKKIVPNNESCDFPALSSSTKDKLPACNDFQTFSKVANHDDNLNFNLIPSNDGSKSIMPNYLYCTKSISSVSDSKSGSTPESPIISPICSTLNKNSKERAIQLNLMASNTPENRRAAAIRLLDNHSIQSMESASLTSNCSQSNNSNETLNGCTDMETNNGSSSTLKDSTSSLSNVESANFDPFTLPTEKRSTLKRNNSAAGYIPSRNGDEDKNSNQESKQQWYGTWGGRKHKRKSAHASMEAAAGGLQFGRQLKKLPVSKGSLSSLVGRLKPKRSKSLYQTNQMKTADEFSLALKCNSEQNDSKSLDLYVDSTLKLEDVDDDIFLPRVTEELDLESEILKSSSMLANFYSLKRSDLRNKNQVDQSVIISSGLENGHDHDWNSEDDCKFISDKFENTSTVKT